MRFVHKVIHKLRGLFFYTMDHGQVGDSETACQPKKQRLSCPALYTSQSKNIKFSECCFFAFKQDNVARLLAPPKKANYA